MGRYAIVVPTGTMVGMGSTAIDLTGPPRTAPEPTPARTFVPVAGHDPARSSTSVPWCAGATGPFDRWSPPAPAVMVTGPMTAAATRFDRTPRLDAALDDRVRYLIALRFLIAAITIVFAFASPASLAVASQALVAAACAYVVVALVAVGLGRRADRVGAVATVGMLLLDGVFLAIAVYGTGGSTSPLRFLLYLQLLAVSLLASPRAGLAIAGWDTLLFGAVFAAQAGGLIAPVDARPGEALDVRVLPVMNAVAFWVFAVALAAFSAINERELRQRRADLEAVVRIGIQIEDEGDPVRQAAIVLDGLIGPYALARGLVIGADDDGLVVLGARGISIDPRTEIPLDPIIRRAWAEGRPITQSWLDRRTDPGLSRPMTGARRSASSPPCSPTAGRSVPSSSSGGTASGRASSSGRLASRRQVASMTAVNVRNAVLLRRVRDVDERDALTGAANRRMFQAEPRADAVCVRRQGPRDAITVGPVHRPRRLQGRQRHAGSRRRRRAAGRRSPSASAGSFLNGDLVARLGGDEFAILTEDSPDLAAVARDGRPPRRGAAGAVRHRRRPVVVTSSIGIASADDAESGPAVLARNADVAMYMAKANGKSGFAVFDPGMHAALRERHELSVELQRAVELDQLRLVYQPIIDLATSAMRRRRGAGPLAAPGTRPDRPGPVHRDRRGARLDPVDRPLGPPRGLCARPGAGRARRLAPSRCPSPSTCRHARSSSPASSTASARRSASPASSRQRSSSRSPRRPCCGPHATIADPRRACATWGSAWSSTTSGPATSRSATSAGSRSTS